MSSHVDNAAAISDPSHFANGISPANTGTTPTEHDVLMGRGKRVYNHEGNVHFRSLVAEKAACYETTKSKAGRRAIARSIIQEIESRGGRFLRPATNGRKNDLETTPPTIVLTKVKQALRDCAATMFGGSGGEEESKVPQVKSGATVQRGLRHPALPTALGVMDRVALLNPIQRNFMNHHQDLKLADCLTRHALCQNQGPLSAQVPSQMDSSQLSLLFNQSSALANMLAPPQQPAYNAIGTHQGDGTTAAFGNAIRASSGVNLHPQLALMDPAILPITTSFHPDSLLAEQQRVVGMSHLALGLRPNHLSPLELQLLLQQQQPPTGVVAAQLPEQLVLDDHSRRMLLAEWFGSITAATPTAVAPSPQQVDDFLLSSGEGKQPEDESSDDDEKCC